MQLPAVPEPKPCQNDRAHHALEALDAVQAALTLATGTLRRRSDRALQRTTTAPPRPLGLGHEPPFRPAYPWLL
jgi:hypothetical protein